MSSDAFEAVSQTKKAFVDAERLVKSLNQKLKALEIAWCVEIEDKGTSEKLATPPHSRVGSVSGGTPRHQSRSESPVSPRYSANTHSESVRGFHILLDRKDCPETPVGSSFDSLVSSRPSSSKIRSPAESFKVELNDEVFDECFVSSLDCLKATTEQRARVLAAQLKSKVKQLARLNVQVSQLERELHVRDERSWWLTERARSLEEEARQKDQGIEDLKKAWNHTLAAKQDQIESLQKSWSAKQVSAESSKPHYPNDEDTVSIFRNSLLRQLKEKDAEIAALKTKLNDVDLIHEQPVSKCEDVLRAVMSEDEDTHQDTGCQTSPVSPESHKQEKMVDDWRMRLLSATQQLEDKDSRIISLERRIRELEAIEKENLREWGPPCLLTAAEERSQQLHTESLLITTKHEELQAEVKRLEDALRGKAKAQEHLKTRLAALEEELKVRNAVEQQLRLALDPTKKELSSCKTQCEQLAAELEVTRAEARTIHETHEGARKSESSLRIRIQHLEESLRAKEALLLEQRQKAHKLGEQVNLLNSLAVRFHLNNSHDSNRSEASSQTTSPDERTYRGRTVPSAVIGRIHPPSVHAHEPSSAASAAASGDQDKADRISLVHAETQASSPSPDRSLTTMNLQGQLQVQLHEAGQGQDQRTAMLEVAKENVEPLSARTVVTPRTVHRRPPLKKKMPSSSGIILEGYLLKQGLAHNNWKKRWFELRPDSLTYYHKERAEEPDLVIPLSDVTNVCPINAPDSNVVTFQIITRHHGDHVMQTFSRDHAIVWINAIRSRLKRLTSTTNPAHQVGQMRNRDPA